jgi:multidrug efflux system outer membrane protein
MCLLARLRKKQGTLPVVARHTALGFLIFLPSCQIPDQRYAESAATLPEHFAGKQAVTTDSAAQLRIDEFFQDPVLLGLINQAMAGNQELKILSEEVEIANNEILLRRGAYMPFVSLKNGVGYERSSLFTPLGTAERELSFQPGKHFSDPLPNFLLAADISWQVDIWHKLRNARDAASLRYLATNEGRNYVVTRLVAEIAEHYYSLMAFDNRLVTLEQTITLQKESLRIAKAKKDAGRDTELAVQRFTAEVSKNESEVLIVKQEIIEMENRLNFLLGRFPQQIVRPSAQFLDLQMHALSAGVPSQLLRNRPDIRQAEHELAAAGLEVDVARAEFYPSLDITAGLGFQAFNPKYLFNPDALLGGVAGEFVTPLMNKTAIQAAYKTANAKQLQSIYQYQKVILDAFTEVMNRISMAENYQKSIDIKKKQLAALELSVSTANKLFQNARAEYSEVLFAQRDMLEARMILIETKRKQLSAVIGSYQALGGGGTQENGASLTLPPHQ